MSATSNLKTQIGVRLNDNDLKRLQTHAEKLGLHTSTVIRMWIKEKLREIEQGRAIWYKPGMTKTDFTAVADEPK